MASNQSVYPCYFNDAILSPNGMSIETKYFFTPAQYPLYGLLFYIATLFLFTPSTESVKKLKEQQKNDKNQGKKRKFGLIELIIFIHNVTLAVFSVLCCYNTAPLIFNLFKSYNFNWNDVTCNHYKVYEDTNYGYWAYLFYLSKYYEFIDTWIVMARGRRPISLQIYHHIGAVIGMWLITVTKSSGGFYFIVENSFIHSIMYTYYAASVIGIKFKFKFVITLLQMLQFIIGISGTVIQLIAFRGCLRVEDVLSMIYLVIYVSILFIMFLNFYNKTYNAKKKKAVRKVYDKKKE